MTYAEIALAGHLYRSFLQRLQPPYVNCIIKKRNQIIIASTLARTRFRNTSRVRVSIALCSTHIWRQIFVFKFSFRGNKRKKETNSVNLVLNQCCWMQFKNSFNEKAWMPTESSEHFTVVVKVKIFNKPKIGLWNDESSALEFSSIR